MWSVATKSLVSTYTGHADYVNAVVAMPDGQRILSSSGDSSLGDKTVVWRLSGTLENTFELHAGWVNALALPDNQHALSSDDRTVKLFNVNDGGVLRTFKHHTDSVYCLALPPDGLRCSSAARST